MSDWKSLFGIARDYYITSLQMSKFDSIFSNLFTLMDISTSPNDVNINLYFIPGMSLIRDVLV